MKETVEKIWNDIQWAVGGILVWFFIFGTFDTVKGWVHPAHVVPIAIEADGQSYVACNNPTFAVSAAGSGKYYIDFKDATGSNVSLLGISKLSVSDLPQMIAAPFPDNAPVPIGKDSGGNDYADGAIYTWKSGAKAQVKGGQWVPVLIHNPVCSTEAAGAFLFCLRPF